MIECESCHREIQEEEEVYKILGMVKKTFILVPHIYCKSCGEELVTKYKKKGKWILEKT